MLTRRRFQPSLDELATRIAPSAVVAVPVPDMPAPPPIVLMMDAATPPTDDGSDVVASPPVNVNPPDPGLC